MQDGFHSRKANGILGILCRRHFPGIVLHAGKNEPAYTIEHYTAARDILDRRGRVFDNKAVRVYTELWVSLHISLCSSIYHIHCIFLNYS